MLHIRRIECSRKDVRTMKASETLALAAEYLPPAVRRAVLSLPEEMRSGVQEIRLRAGRSVTLTMRGEDRMLAADGLTEDPSAMLIPTAEDIARSLQAVLSYSVHSHRQELSEGFATIRGGCRVGFCGTAVRDGDAVQSLKNVSALNFRIAAAYPGCAAAVFRQTGQAGGILAAGRPGAGKTTFLRDLCRLLGDRSRTALIDERGELAAVRNGVPGHDTGRMTEVLDGYPRASGILTALRVLNPTQIVCDELLGQADADAVLAAAGCGVQISASVHAGSMAELEKRQFLAPLLEAGVFRYAVFLDGMRVQSVRRLS